MTAILLLVAGAALLAAGAVGLVLAWRDPRDERAATAPLAAAVAVAGGAVSLVAGGGTAGSARGAALALLVAVVGLAQVAVLHATSVEGRVQAPADRPALGLVLAMVVAAVAGAVLAVFGGEGGGVLLGVEVMAAPITTWAAAVGRRGRWLAWVGLVALSIEALGFGVLLAVAHDLRWSVVDASGHRGWVDAALVLAGVGAGSRLVVALVAARVSVEAES